MAGAARQGRRIAWKTRVCSADAGRRLLWLVLAVLAAKGLFEGGYYALLYSQDFQWSPAVLLGEGHDPYAWYLNGNPRGRIILSQEPNYLHGLYLLLLPFAALPWPLAKAAWGLFNSGAGVLGGVMIAREAGLSGARLAASVAVFVAASPFAHALGNGQASLLVLAAMILAWRARATAFGGVAAALAASKYSFAPPVFIWLMIEGRFRALGVAALTGLAGLLAFAALCGVSPLPLAFEPLQVSARATHVGLADVMSFARALDIDDRLGSAPVYLAGLAVAALGVGLLWSRRPWLGDFAVFALLCQLSLFALFHQLYDYVLLMPLFCLALTRQGAVRALTLAYVGFFWFVVQFIDATAAMKTPAAIGAMAFASYLIFAFVALQPLPSARSIPATSAAAL